MAVTATLDKELPDLYAVGDTMTLTVVAPPEDRSLPVDVDVRVGAFDLNLHGGIGLPISVTDAQGREWGLQDDDGTTAHYTSVASLPAA